MAKTKTNTNSDFSTEIRRARIDCLNIYEISEGELETFEKGSPGSIFLNFAIFILGAVFTLIAALLTTEIKSNITQVVFIVLIIFGFLSGILLLILWYRNYRSVSKQVDLIRKRLPREEIPPINDNGQNNTIHTI